MQMMYEVIYKALQEVGLENVFEPQDYLIFFCLGTRESSQGTEQTSNEKGSNGANTSQVHIHSPSLILLHSYHCFLDFYK